MTCSGRLTGLLPPCRWDYYLVSGVCGYELRLRHAHPGGLMTDCPPEDYGPLSHDELIDVFEAVLDEIQYDERPF